MSFPTTSDTTPPSSTPVPLSRPRLTDTTSRHRTSQTDHQSAHPPWGPDSSRRRSLIDLLSMGVIADPWRELPWGWRWRSSPWFLTSLVGMGIATDILTYTIVVPVLPFRLQSQGYTNVSNLTSYLLVGYSAGLTVATPFISFIFHRYPHRRAPLLAGLVTLQLSLVLFMLADPFWCAMVSRVLQGVSSAVVWSVGMALICENVEEAHVGRQLGFAIGGVSIGGSIGPVIGGALYDRLGWYAPFIFCIIICGIDFVGRLLLVERKELARWGIGMDGKDLVAPGDQEDERAGERQERVEEVDDGGKEEGRVGGSGLVDRAVTPSPTPTLGRTPTTEIQLNEKVTKTPRSIQSVENGEIPPEKGSPIKEDHLSPIQVIVKLFSSPRALTGLSLVFCFALAISSLDPVLALRIQAVWDKDALFVGIVYLCASIPTFFTGPIFGHLSDKYGAEWLAAPLIVLTLPWTPILILRKSLAGFIIVFTIWNGFLSAVVAPVGQELAMVSKQQKGISEIHQFGAFNMAFSIGSLIGPFFGGQIYDAIPNGWTILCWLWLAFMALPLIPALMYTGERPLARRLFDKGYKTKEQRQVDEAKEADLRSS